ncbi:MAG TPA: hypothetical protein VEL75_20925 [Candidatus Methylomirabilis sp.]|nr:hypothetical protein [Candidatus Methylomirabilis sp.]
MQMARSAMAALGGVLLLTGALLAGPAAAQDVRPQKDLSLTDDAASPAKPDKSFLDAMAKDLGLSLLDKSSENTLRLTLAPRDWSLQPYAALQTRSLKAVTDPAGLSAPDRDFTDDPLKGMGVGAGVRWQLSDHLDLYGQYLFSTPGGSTTTNGPFVKPGIDSSPGLKGGFSIKF